VSTDLFSPRVLKARPGGAPGKGRGVFASAAFAPGELVDAALCIEMDAEACTRVVGTRIDDYYFYHPDGDALGLLVLGLASLCNHSAEPNTETRYERDPDLGWVVLLTATRAIREGEELTRRYACAPWFESTD